MTFVNLTPHAIRLNDGREFPPRGALARVTATFTPFDKNGVCYQEFGKIQGLPENLAILDDIVYIVSAIVLAALKQQDEDQRAINAFAPATGHPECKRDEKGQIVSVPGFVR